MPFDLSNFNIAPGSETAGLAEDMNKVFEALADGVDFSDDAAPVALGFASIAGRLQGKTKREIALMVAKAATANVFDELAEAAAAEPEA